MAIDSRLSKRIIVCCDGTWMDSDGGYSKPTLFPYHPNAVLQIPSNVTRISRAFKRYGRDGKHQIIYYHSGVGTGASAMDSITGGALGMGISENVREAYSFITANYVPGDEIILLGFSRGAFTARSVAGLIRDIGLLTREGMKDFCAVYKDSANRHNEKYHDIFAGIPFENKPKPGTPGSDIEYRDRLVASGLTRVNDPNGDRIRITAVGVWDTVGSLGIPNLTILAKLGLPHSTKEFKFYDTALHSTIKHAFQALALDEHRSPFSPAIWERPNDVVGTDLRQVWFPGSHANVGGGYEDQEVANVTLAWMMDQLSSIGVSFKDTYIDQIHADSVKFYQSQSQHLLHPNTCSKLLSPHRPRQPWVSTSISDNHKPIRPYGLGKIYESEEGIWLLAGKKIRTPGLYTRMNPSNGLPTTTPLTQTNERIHSSIRLRLKLQGLSPDDKGAYTAPALLGKGYWMPVKRKIDVWDPVGEDAGLKWGGGDHDDSISMPVGFASNDNPDKSGRGRETLSVDGNGDRVNGDDKAGQAEAKNKAETQDRADTQDEAEDEAEEGNRWVWIWVGPEDKAPKERVLVEENLGPYERRLLALDRCEEVRGLVLG